MKWLLAVGLVLAQDEEESSVLQNCLYCKNADMEADFMYSYSYCPSEDKCVADKWNKFNAWCTEAWIPGYKLDIIADCKAEVKKFCLSFISSDVSENDEYTAT